MVGLRMWEGVRGGGRESFQEGSPPLPAHRLLRQGSAREEGRSVSTQHWVPGSNTNRGKDRHVRKRQGLQGTGWTLQTRGKAFGNSSPCTINDQGTGSP